jgi:hypothetical protein
MMIQAVRLCPAIKWHGPCDIPTCAQSKYCRLIPNQRWAGLCKIPDDHPVQGYIAHYRAARGEPMAAREVV